MTELKQMGPPYPTEDNRPYPPPYTEQAHQINNFPPLPDMSQDRSPYPQLGPGNSSDIPQPYPPYPPTDIPPVTSAPGAGYGYPPHHGGVTSVQIVEVPTNFGSESQYVRCPNCGTQSFTTVEHKATTTTHLMALLLCCFILWPIAWLPYVCTSCQSTVHYCSNCNQYLGERNV